MVRKWPSFCCPSTLLKLRVVIRCQYTGVRDPTKHLRGPDPFRLEHRSNLEPKRPCFDSSCWIPSSKHFPPYMSSYCGETVIWPPGSLEPIKNKASAGRCRENIDSCYPLGSAGSSRRRVCFRWIASEGLSVGKWAVGLTNMTWKLTLFQGL